jgi:hypothetical protein
LGTIPGIGSLSGKFIRGIGKIIIRQIEDVAIIRRRISYIQSLCPLSDDSPPEDVVQIYDDLLELARSVVTCNVNSRPNSDLLHADLASTLGASKSNRCTSSANS